MGALTALLLVWPYSLYVPSTDFRLVVPCMALAICFGTALIIKEPHRLARLKQFWLLPIYVFLAIHLVSWIIYPVNDFSRIIDLLAVIATGSMWVTTFDTRKEFVSSLVVAIGGMVALNVVLMGLHYMWFHRVQLTPTFTLSHYYTDGFTSKNRLALTLAIFLPFLYAGAVRKKTIWTIIGAVLMGVALVFIYSRMGILAIGLMVVAPIFLFKQVRDYTLTAATIFLVVGVGMGLTGTSTSDYLRVKKAINESATLRESHPEWIVSMQTSRGRYIRTALVRVPENWLFGHGFETYSRQNPEFWPDGSIKRYPATHNDYVLVLYEFGVLGLGAFFAMFAVAMWRLWRLRRCSDWLAEGVTISMINLVLVMIMINTYTAIIFWFVLASVSMVLRPRFYE